MRRFNECQICGKQLSDPQSLALGVGPDCAEKKSKFLAGAGTSEDELQILAAVNSESAKWIRNFHTDMRLGRVAYASHAISAARRAAGALVVEKIQEAA